MAYSKGAGPMILGLAGDAPRTRTLHVTHFNGSYIFIELAILFRFQGNSALFSD